MSAIVCYRCNVATSRSTLLKSQRKRKQDETKEGRWGSRGLNWSSDWALDKASSEFIWTISMALLIKCKWSFDGAYRHWLTSEWIRPHWSAATLSSRLEACRDILPPPWSISAASHSAVLPLIPPFSPSPSLLENSLHYDYALREYNCVNLPLIEPALVNKQTKIDSPNRFPNVMEDTATHVTH